jgi:hypothetical protein
MRRSLNPADRLQAKFSMKNRLQANKGGRKQLPNQ